MATVEVTFTPLPAHVRTARLVATAVARRSGVDESLLDEVRLAVGEACSRAVEAHQRRCPRQPIRVRLSDDGERFEVVVTDAVPADEATTVTATGQGQAERTAAAGGNGTAPGAAAPGDTHRDGTEPDGVVHQLPAEVGLAVIAGLADDIRIEPDGDGTSVAMSWKHRTPL